MRNGAVNYKLGLEPRAGGQETNTLKLMVSEEFHPAKSGYVIAVIYIYIYIYI